MYRHKRQYHVVTDIYDIHDYDQNPATFKEHYDELATDGILYEQVNSAAARQCTTASRSLSANTAAFNGARRKQGLGYGGAQTEEFIDTRPDRLARQSRDFRLLLHQLYDIEQGERPYTYGPSRIVVFKTVNYKAAIE